MDISVDIKKLETLALAATQGKWTCGEKPEGRFWQIGCGNQAIGATHSASMKHNPEYASVFEANAKYIAAANPAAVLQLIAEIKQLRQQVANDGLQAQAEAAYDDWAQERDE